jgi:hypothetical protein
LFYCSIEQMSRELPLSSVALLALLLPGLVMAAPVAGACGLCDRGVPCPSMAAEAPAAAAHLCCGGEVADAPARPAPSTLGAEACDCGRAAPPAVAAVGAPAPDNDPAAAPIAALRPVNVGHQVAGAEGGRAPAPPPHPLIFLIDCVSLT